MNKKCERQHLAWGEILSATIFWFIVDIAVGCAQVQSMRPFDAVWSIYNIQLRAVMVYVCVHVFISYLFTDMNFCKTEQVESYIEDFRPEWCISTIYHA